MKKIFLIPVLIGLIIILCGSANASTMAFWVNDDKTNANSDSYDIQVVYAAGAIKPIIIYSLFYKTDQINWTKITSLGKADLAIADNASKYLYWGLGTSSTNIVTTTGTFSFLNKVNNAPGYAIALLNFDNAIDLELIRADQKNGINFSSTAQFPAVSTVPIPGAIWLMGSGLLGIMGLRKKAPGRG